MYETSNFREMLIDEKNALMPIGSFRKRLSWNSDTLFIVDESNRLLGAVTSGDINRFAANAAQLMNASPKYVLMSDNDHLEKAERIFSGFPNIRAIPVLDDKSRILSMLLPLPPPSIHTQRDASLVSMEDINTVFRELNMDERNYHYKRWLGRLLDFPIAWKFISSYILEHFPKNAKILDIACGAGPMTCFLAGHGYGNLHGIDFSEVAISIAREIATKKNYGVQFSVDDALNPSFDACDTDLAYSLGFVGNCIGFKNAAGNTPMTEMIKRLLLAYDFQPGAHVMLDVYDDLSNFNLARKKCGHYGAYDHFEYMTVGYHDFKETVAEIGYEIIDKCCDPEYGIKIAYVLKKAK